MTFHFHIDEDIYFCAILELVSGKLKHHKSDLHILKKKIQLKCYFPFFHDHYVPKHKCG